ncbi:MAG: hypothetical protein AAFS13_01690 [Pseudomonadota bacterium]
MAHKRDRLPRHEWRLMNDELRLVYLERVFCKPKLAAEYRRRILDIRWCDALGRRLGWPDRPRQR